MGWQEREAAEEKAHEAEQAQIERTRAEQARELVAISFQKTFRGKSARRQKLAGFTLSVESKVILDAKFCVPLLCEALGEIVKGEDAVAHLNDLQNTFDHHHSARAHEFNRVMLKVKPDAGSVFSLDDWVLVGGKYAGTGKLGRADLENVFNGVCSYRDGIWMTTVRSVGSTGNKASLMSMTFDGFTHALVHLCAMHVGKQRLREDLGEPYEMTEFIACSTVQVFDRMEKNSVLLSQTIIGDCISMVEYEEDATVGGRLALLQGVVSRFAMQLEQLFKYVCACILPSDVDEAGSPKVNVIPRTCWIRFVKRMQRLVLVQAEWQYTNDDVADDMFSKAFVATPRNKTKETRTRW